MRKIIFYGDSNTYGYDPRDFFGGCYPPERIWTSRVAEAFSGTLTVCNEGMNGRCLPFREWDLRYVEHLFQDFGFSGEDLFAVMLGTNDLLSSMEPDAEVPVERMSKLLAWLTERLDPARILVIAPAWIAANRHPDPALLKYREENVKMNEGFRLLAGQYHTFFADAAGWKIDLAFDGVHFSEKGHAQFAEHMISLIRTLTSPKCHAEKERFAIL